MAARNDIAVVEAVYDAFSRADLQQIMELFAPDCVVYQSPRLPWGGTHEGHEGLVLFLMALASAISSTPEHEHLVADGDGHVSQVGRTRGTVKRSGATFDLYENHVWTVRHGRIARFEVYLDTAGMLAALGAPPA